ncbi:DUF3093 domain-containing protein [Microbacterium rhizomatis]|uniref:DUF3093 domain-containing protein n=1 Tax=Microbacterium rhizomatis TaxID=1631477 RepID=A0A5J5J3B3_9MICO|nr:DUF3093 domain-containing protein [Microbacterium rhizomatis]KAA9110520.1 DUF3093 domain-containing protein [Microbacterium rhizomatis]
MSSIRTPSGVVFRERLSPSLWALVSAALCGPMIALVFTPIDKTLALVLGAIVGVAVVVLLVAASPTVEVSDGWLRAGRARIELSFLGETQTFSGEDARNARGPGLHPRAWHLFRGGIDGVVVVAVKDPDDPVPFWALSTRTPDRLAAAIRRAEPTRSTPRR